MEHPAPTTVGGGDPLETGGAPDLSGTLSPAAPNLTLGTAADGAVAPGRNGVHPSETGGSQISQGMEVQMILILPWERLPTAL